MNSLYKNFGVFKSLRYFYVYLDAFHFKSFNWLNIMQSCARSGATVQGLRVINFMDTWVLKFNLYVKSKWFLILKFPNLSSIE